MHIQNRILVGTVNNKDAYENLHNTIERGNQIFITIHETSLGLRVTPDDRTITHYENWLLNPDTLKGEHELGYHFMVSDKEAVQFISTKFRTAHASCFDGNSSIDIQWVVNCNVNFHKAFGNLAKLVATLMSMFKIPFGHIIPRSLWENPNSSLQPTEENLQNYFNRIYHILGNTPWLKFSELVAYLYLHEITFNLDEIL